MNSLSRTCWVNSLALGAVVWSGAAIASAQTAVPVPKATQLPITFFAPEMNNSPSDAFPLVTASRNLRPYDLKKAGYVEEEYIVTGNANVYDWDTSGKLSVLTANAPYGTRLLVRRPADPAKFSGAVVVEIPNAARRFDWHMMWGYLSDAIMQRGDAWVSPTIPTAVSGLKTFNPTRYAAVAFNNPNPGACPATPQNPADFEDGLKWDMLSQVGALLKSNTPGGPLAGFKVEALYMTTQGGDVVTYAHAIHSSAKLANGKPVYDGYIFKQPVGVGRINRCAAPVQRTDSRNMTRNIGVPVIAVVAQGEVVGALASRRPDSDEAADRYRRYEVAGGSHLDRYPYFAFPSMNDAATAGNAQGTPEFPFAARCEPEIQLIQYPLMPFIYHSALDHIDKWARKGIAPPKAPRMLIKNADTPQASLSLDANGVAAGGIRSFWSDIPTFNLVTSSPGPGFCPELGHSEDFAWPRLEAAYGNYKSYAAKAAQSIDKSVKDGWIMDADGKKMKAEIAAAAAPASRTTGGNN